MGFGSLLGRLAGTIGSALLPIKGVDGGELGATLGGLTGFKNGGRVKRTGPAYLHKGEFVLRKGIAPTKSQKERTTAGKKRGGGKKGGGKKGGGKK